MALKVAEVLIRWRSQGSQDVENSTKRMSQSLTALGDKAKAVGGVLSVGLTAPLTLIGKQAVDAASDLNESLSQVETVFGSTADQMIRFTRTAASQLGQSRQAALAAAGALGALFDGVGLTETQMADFSSSLLTAAADLGSFYNVDPGMALENLRSGLVGEAEPLRKFGILINEAAVETKALELGLIAAGDEMTEAQKVQARYALIMDQLGVASGDFARTSGGLANSQRILAARLQDVRAEIGTYLLPYALRAVEVGGQLLDRFQSLDDRTKGLAVALGAAAAAAGPVLVIFGQLVSSAASLGPLIGALTGPVGLVVAAVAGLALAFKTDFLGIRTTLQPIIDGVGETLTRMTRFFQAAKDRGLTPFRLAMRTLIVSLSERLGDDHPVVRFLRGILRNGEKLAGWITNTGIPKVQEFFDLFSSGDFEGAKDIAGQLLADIKGGWDRTVGPWLTERLDSVKTFGATLLSNMVESLKTVNWGLIGDTIRNGLGAFASWIGDRLDQAKTFGAQLLQFMLDGLGQVNWPLVAQAVKDGLGQFADWVGDRLGEALTFAGSLLQNLIKGFQGINWSTVGSAVQTGLQFALGGLKELGTWVLDRLREVDWNNVGAQARGLIVLVGQAMLAAVHNELLAFRDLGTWVWDRLQEVNWDQARSSLFASGETLISAGAEGVGGLLGGILQQFANVATFFQNIGASIINALPKDWAMTLYNVGADLIGGMFKGMQDTWATVETWLGERKKALEEFLGLVEKAEAAPLPNPSQRPGKDQNIPEEASRALGGPLGRRYTLVGEYGPELLINKQLVMPHGASMSRIEAMGGMANGGTLWGAWLARQDRTTRQMVRAMRGAGGLNAANRRELMGDIAIAEDGSIMPASFYRRNREPAGTRRARRQHERNSDALNRANDYGDRTGDYSRRERVLAREARNGRLAEGGLSRQEREYIINVYGSLNVYADDPNVGRKIAETIATRRR